MNDSPFIPFYTSDFLAGTSGMTAATKGVYITLLSLMYEAEAPLSQKWDTLARRCGCTLSSFKKAVETLEDDGKLTVKDGDLWSPKCDKHITQRRERSESASAAAKKRWEKIQQKQSNEDTNAPLAQCKPEPEPYINDDTNVSSRRSDKDQGFDSFWDLWPSKKNKQNARKAWRKLKIEDKRAAYSALKAGWFEQWQSASPDANPIHAATFLNARRWEDQQAAPKLRPIEGGRNGKRSITERMFPGNPEVDCGPGGNPSQSLPVEGDSHGSRGSCDDGLGEGPVGLLAGPNLASM